MASRSADPEYAMASAQVDSTAPKKPKRGNTRVVASDPTYAMASDPSQINDSEYALASDVAAEPEYATASNPAGGSAIEDGSQYDIASNLAAAPNLKAHKHNKSKVLNLDNTYAMASDISTTDPHYDAASQQIPTEPEYATASDPSAADTSAARKVKLGKQRSKIGDDRAVPADQDSSSTDPTYALASSAVGSGGGAIEDPYTLASSPGVSDPEYATASDPSGLQAASHYDIASNSELAAHGAPASETTAVKKVKLGKQRSKIGDNRSASGDAEYALASGSRANESTYDLATSPDPASSSSDPVDVTYALASTPLEPEYATASDPTREGSGAGIVTVAATSDVSTLRKTKLGKQRSKIGDNRESPLTADPTYAMATNTTEMESTPREDAPSAKTKPVVATRPLSKGKLTTEHDYSLASSSPQAPSEPEYATASDHTYEVPADIMPLRSDATYSLASDPDLETGMQRVGVRANNI